MKFSLSFIKRNFCGAKISTLPATLQLRGAGKRGFHWIAAQASACGKHAKFWATNFWYKGTLFQRRLKRSGAVTTGVAAILIIALLILPFQQLKAANYNKTWTSTADFDTGTKSNIDTASNEAKLATTTSNFSEGFTGTTYKDATTDANWDTVAHKLTLPGDPTSGVATDLQAKWKAAVGVTETIQFETYDSTNHFVYLGGSSGSFAAYNVSTQAVISLTSKISADWSTNVMYALTFDSTNGKIYLGGQSGKFGVFTGGSDPANGTWVYLTAKISADWSTYAVNALTFDSTNGKVYLGGAAGKFGVFTGGSDPANGTWVYLTAKISADWSTYAVNALTFDSTNGKVYLGGGSSSGKFGVFTGGSDPANGTWVYLTAKISADWSTYAVNALTFDSTNGKVYLGGDSGKFGAFTGGSDPANGTWVYLTAKISADWSTYAVNALTFDSTNGKVYLGGDSGKFGAFTGGADPVNGTWSYLASNVAAAFAGYAIKASSYDSTNGFLYLGGSGPTFAAYKLSDGTMVGLSSKVTNWAGGSINSMTFDSINGKVYLGGENSRFGVFTGGSDPANGTWVYLTTQLTSPDFDNASYWTGGYTILSLAFDSTNSYIYLGGQNGRFGAVQATATPGSVTTWTYLTTQLATPDFDNASYWSSTKGVIALSFDSTNSYIYLGGETGRFGAVQATATPGSVTTWTYLTTQLATPDFDNASYWSTSAINSLTFDSTNGYIYLGGASGRFGAVQATATPDSVTTWTYLTTQLSSPDFDNASYWSTSIIYSLTFAGGKIFLGGASGKFGVFTGGSNPGSVTTWSYLYSNISDINGANQINTLTYVSSAATVFIGSATGKFTSFLVGYTSNKNGISLAVDNTARQITKATLTATDSKPANTAITYYLSNNGGVDWNVVTSGAQYTFSTSGSDLRWKANLTTTDVAVTPEITNIAIAYVFYTASSGTLNLKYDASQTVVIVGLAGTLSTPANTTLVFKVRAAATEGGLATATWSDNIPAANLPKDLRTINVGGQTGFSDNQWSEIQADFATTDDLNTPTLSDLTLTYVINQAPQLQTVTASQATDGSKIINIDYEVKDPDASTNPYNQNQVAISLKYSIDNGANYLDCTTTTGTGLKTVSESSFTPYTATWNAGTDLPDAYYPDLAKIKVLANDNEQAHNTAELASATFSIDTKNPAPQAITGGFTGIRIADGTSWTNDTTPDLVLSASDDTAMTMKVSNDNFVTGDWESYATSKAGWALSANDGNKTVYVRFRDAFGNYADSNSTVLLDTTPPNVPAHFSIFDTSSQDLGTYSVTSMWDVISNPGDFSLYQLERSTNGSDYTELATFSNIASDVYADKSLSNTITYYYRLRTKDIHTNYSAYTDVKSLMPVGVDTAAPEISGPGPTSAATSTTANITWLTNEIADSYVEFGTTISYGSMQGSDNLISSHSITLVGLNPTTTYHYRVKSRDATGNRVTSADYTFTTTLPEEANSGVNITGATAQKPGADPEEVTIIWTTDKYSTSQVLYGKTESLGSQTDEDSTLNKTHYITITHLDSNTKYYYKARSEDTYGNVIEGELKYFVTSASEAAAPSVKGVEATDITLNSAIISWETTTVTSSIVELGIGDGYSGRVEDISAGSTTKHVIRLKDLSEGTKYHFRVLGMNSDQGWVASDDYQFSTISFPTISGIYVKDVASVGATIIWQTNVPTDSNVDYGADSPNVSQGSGEQVTSHEISLIGLKPATKYLYKIRVRDKYGNRAISETQSFQTVVDATAPLIKDMKSEVSIITDSNSDSKAQAIISWSTDEPATSQVKYAQGVASADDYPLKTQEEPGLSTSHVVIISNLQPSATYHMRLLSKDSSDNIATSDDYTVLTLNQEKSLLQYIIQILEERFYWLKTFGLF